MLIHKGTQVNSGHYVAHIKDEKTGQWWKFDDEHVLNLGIHPLGERTSNGDVDTFSSDDAYMLMYTLRHSMKCDTGSGSLPPLHLCEEIKTINAVYLTSCQQYKFTEEEMKEMNHKVRSISSESSVGTPEEPSILDKTSSQCLHRKVPASKVACLKRLAAEAWTKLFSKHSSESSECPPVLECLPSPVSDIDSKVYQSNDQSVAQATSLFHLRRSRISCRSSQRCDRPSVDSGALSTGDCMAIVGAASSLLIVTVGKPTEFLSKCICKGSGAALSCKDCNPYPFFIFEGWMAGTFSLSTIVIAGLYWRPGKSSIAVFHALFGVPFFGWSVYQTVPLAYRYLVLIMDAGLFALAVFIWMCYWFARRWARRARHIPL